ncbi:MAG TPA: hypothetical protein DHV37_05925 [Erysipelotrichaceae bacterium]|nr:hypothetical protein [Erysipelotrichaceae bacterium]
MALRNFWLDGHIDGRESRICGGPRSKDGGMTLVLDQRDEGCSVEVLTIDCIYEYRTDEVVTYVKDGDGNVIKEIRTKR